MIQLMLYQLPESIGVWHSVDGTCGPHHFYARRLKTLLPSGWDHGGGNGVAGKRKRRHCRCQLL